VPEPTEGVTGGSREESGAPRANPAAAPGSSGPGEQGYSGAATVGDEGAMAGPEAYVDPFGRPDSGGGGADERREAAG
jgi:hypothetical protein